MQKNEQDKSQEMFDAIITGMREWRACHPKATMREIEIEARQRVSRLEAHLIEESALQGPANQWADKPPEERPSCSNCGEALVARGRAEAPAASHQGKRGGGGTNLWNLSQLPDRVFSPSMSN